MDESNDTTVVATVPESDTKPAEQPQEQKPDRPKLTDEEQLQILEGRAQRLRTKLGINETKQPSAPETNDLSEAFLMAAGITDDEEVELALTTAKKWDMPVKKLLKDEDFQAKLEKHRANTANIAATSDVKGSGASAQANQSPEYWIAKGVPPTRDQVPDRKTRNTIVQAMLKNEKNGKKFYND